MNRNIMALLIMSFALCMVGYVEDNDDIEYNKTCSKEIEVLTSHSLEDIQKAYVVKEDTTR